MVSIVKNGRLSGWDSRVKNSGISKRQKNPKPRYLERSLTGGRFIRFKPVPNSRTEIQLGLNDRKKLGRLLKIRAVNIGKVFSERRIGDYETIFYIVQIKDGINTTERLVKIPAEFRGKATLFLNEKTGYKIL